MPLQSLLGLQALLGPLFLGFLQYKYVLWLFKVELKLAGPMFSLGIYLFWIFRQDFNGRVTCDQPSKKKKTSDRSLMGAWPDLHSGQTHDVCTIRAIIFQSKIPTNVESCTLTAKLNAFSENVSFLRQVCVNNEVTDVHKFYQREIRFIRTFSASFSYDLYARKRLNWFNLQGSGRPEAA